MEVEVDVGTDVDVDDYVGVDPVEPIDWELKVDLSEFTADVIAFIWVAWVLISETRAP